MCVPLLCLCVWLCCCYVLLCLCGIVWFLCRCRVVFVSFRCVLYCAVGVVSCVGMFVVIVVCWCVVFVGVFVV